MVTESGDVVHDRRLLRSDNLQDLPPESVQVLLDEFHLTDVVDLRTFVEVVKEGEGPLRAVRQVRHHHFTLYREDTDESGIPAAEKALPWETDERADRAVNGAAHDPSHDQFWSEHYLRYLATRPDSVVAALHAISTSEGAAIVHCAAGKDRTGTIVGMALKLVGVRDDEIVADYAASAVRVPRILDRLRTKPAYAANLPDKKISITINGSDTTPNGTKIDVEVGQPIEFDVTADKAGEIHVHSSPEEQEFEYRAGSGQTFTVKPIPAPGQVTVESHTLDKVLFILVAQ